MLPKIKSMVAMGTPEFGFVSQTTMQVKEIGADFTFDLRSFFTVVEVKEF